jgi:hypothetical protein
MSQTVSGATGKPYGVERVCSAWEQARSTFYDRQERAKKSAQGDKPGKRGPTPSVSDEDLLELIPSTGRGTGRSGLACASGKGFGCRESGCCGS